MTVRFIDLFAGMGGIRLGFTAGMKALGIETRCVLASEIKPAAVVAYQNYFHATPVGDITKIPARDIPDFDFLLAGFPCQPFSVAGNRQGFADTRGTLFFEIERILREKQPTGFLLENVDGLVTHDRGRTFQTIKTHLQRLGYHVSYAVLNAADFGLAQSRKRIYIVGLRDGLVDLTHFPPVHGRFADVQEHDQPVSHTAFTQKLLEHFPVETLAGKTITDKRGGNNTIHSWQFAQKGPVSTPQSALLNQLLLERRRRKWAEESGIAWMDGMPLTWAQISRFFRDDRLPELLADLVAKGYLVYEHPKKLVHGKRVPDPTKPRGYNIVTGKLSFEFARILDPHGVTPTLVATDVARLGVIDGGGIRKLTVREALRLCGFPEAYALSGMKYRDAMDLIGNTVCVPVIRAIGTRIAAKLLEGSEYIKKLKVFD